MEGRRITHGRPACSTLTTNGHSLTTATAPAVAASIDATTLRSWVENHDDLVVIDVRAAAEFETLHIRGSYHVPLPLLREHTPEFAARMGTRASRTGPTAREALEQLSSRS